MPADEVTTGAATTGAENEDAEGVALQLRQQLDVLFRLRRIVVAGAIGSDGADTIRVLLQMVEASARRRVGELDEARIAASMGPEALPLRGTACPSDFGGGW